VIPAGFLLVDKPEGLTSFEVLKRLKKAFYSLKTDLTPDEKKSIRDLGLGHCGTLDPFATGLLLVAIGKATRLTQYFLGGSKTYRADLEFGHQTRSGDLTDPVIASTTHLPNDLSAIHRALESFTQGDYFQTPPMSSAKKVNGEKLYELERRGIQIERTPLLRKIESATIHSFSPPCLDFEVTVQSGTYIRVLGEDLAVKCGSLGHLRKLRRLSSSRFSVKDAITLDALCPEVFSTDHSSPSSAFRLFHSIFTDEESLFINSELEDHLRAGRQRPLQNLPGLDPARSFIPLKTQRESRKESSLFGIVRYVPEKAEWRTDHVFPDELA
jgi:tRNA pseudouridine55 synthase